MERRSAAGEHPSTTWRICRFVRKKNSNEAHRLCHSSIPFPAISPGDCLFNPWNRPCYPIDPPVASLRPRLTSLLFIFTEKPQFMGVWCATTLPASVASTLLLVLFHLPIVINANSPGGIFCHGSDVGTCFAAIFGIAIGVVVILAILYFSICWNCRCRDPPEQAFPQATAVQLI